MLNVWKTYSAEEKKAVMEFNEGYIKFISKGKTERVCVDQTIKMAKEKGYRDLKEIIKNGESLKPQDKVFYNMMNKSIALVHIGSNDLQQGMNILGAHIDAPRIDLKGKPLYEKDGLAYFDTHYYGGIKKYQWLARPLALYGVVCKKDGTTVQVEIGEDVQDPVLVITDILPHLAADQLEKPASQFIEGENLDVLIGSIPASDSEKDAVKANVLALLKEKYNIEEDDFVSAELEIVPAGPARSAGLDCSMVLGYGQDDRVCAYTSLMAQLELEEVERTCMTLLVDKEEVGSNGATGMHSAFFENVVAEILNCLGTYSELAVKRTIQNSDALSNDVAAAHDPLYANASSPNNNQAELGNGLAIIKYTGARGKSGCNDANAEFIARLRKIMDENHVVWQISELGKVDQGGGGTVAFILANYGMNVVDAGVALHSMHAPFEIASKADVYEAKKGYAAFLKDCR